ncbi:MAG: acyl-CoA thioesterase [Flavobacteriaceae bacterium]|nr:MAG: acyl-CoA thioesterase [Flavobacteriaceae bacterium]
MKSKKAKESLTILTDTVLPGETNPLNNLFGGELLARMDRATSIAASRHSNCICVTVSVNHVVFTKAVPVGSILQMEAKVSRAFSSSMEVFVDVWKEDRLTGNREKVNEGIYTFVAVNDLGRPIKVPQLIPESKLEKERYISALQRKQLSLVLSGKLAPKEATELRALFE